MSEYKRMNLTDIVNTPNLEGARVEVKGVVRGLQDTVSFFGLNMPFGNKSYTGFLQNGNAFLLFQGVADGYVGAMLELSMLRASSETEISSTLQGKLVVAKASLTGTPLGSNIHYKLKINAVKFGDYNSILFKR